MQGLVTARENPRAQQQWKTGAKQRENNEKQGRDATLGGYAQSRDRARLRQQKTP
jgi:hypothetical protein